MIEVCEWRGSSTAMKHPSQASQHYEFNIGKAVQLRCMNSKVTTCGSCESCNIIDRLQECKNWLFKTGDQTRKRFILGLLRRARSIDLLQNVVNLLQPVLSKDFTYARSRTQPSLSTDRATMSSDRSLPVDVIERNINECWEWFSQCPYWTKANYVTGLLQHCEMHLLYVAGTQAQTLLTSELKAGSPPGDSYESGSVATTEYSYKTDNHPEVELLSKASRQYSALTTTSALDSVEDYEILNNDSDEGDFESELSSVDPACMVIPTSAKAHSGVSKYRDFIRSLPVHLSKSILGYLDMASLSNSLVVSKNWRPIVEEVYKEFFINKELQEEVMLMQGASAQGANPVYANDIDVPVPNLTGNQWEVMKTSQPVIHAKFKSEASYATAYSGVSTRNVIMEERNIYCGAYNIMVLTNENDPHRIMHTDGGQLITTGSKDRKVRFINSETAKSHGPLITGHAGSIKCVCLAEKRNFVLSGSYDTSVRMWSMETGSCLKIFRGHTDTIMTVILYKDKIVSGSRDGSCKVWNLETAKCTRTFKHRAAVSAVAMGFIIDGDDICISGDEAGKVKVWDVRSAQLIKRLDWHHGPVTGIKFDKWHIVTGGKDGYALVWSTWGNHDRCLMTFRHPKEVLCLEFMYLRIITGSADGKVRIWNMITGQCLRIMRGNARSDPILQITAIDDRITLNTVNNLLVLKFEKVEWDYTLEDDKMPPLVQYATYSDAPVRPQPYPYVRAQRMKKAGATNSKIIQQAEAEKAGSRFNMHVQQLEHSAKSLTSRNIKSAKSAQSFVKPDLGYDYEADNKREELRYARLTGTLRPGTAMSKAPTVINHDKKTSYQVGPGKPPRGPQSSVSRASSKQPKSATTIREGSPFSYRQTRPGTSMTQVTMAEPPETYIDDGPPESYNVSRRVSWAFEPHDVPKSKELSMSETKALLRSQIRQKDNVIPPDFIYMTVSAMQSGQTASETSRNTLINTLESTATGRFTRLNRPSSSPSKIDPRTKVPIADMELEQFYPLSKQGSESVHSAETVSTLKSQKQKIQQPVERPNPAATVSYRTEFSSTPVNTKPHVSLHPKRVKSSIPKGRVLRPHTAGLPQPDLSPEVSGSLKRPITAPHLRQTSGQSEAGVSYASTRVKTRHGYATESTAVMTPMLMFPEGYHEKMTQLKLKKEQQQAQQLHILRSSSEPILGKVSKYNDPLRRHVDFKLRSHEQEQDLLKSMQPKINEDEVRSSQEKAKKQLWLKKAKGELGGKDYTRRPKSVAPEIREYWEYGTM